MRKYRLTPSAKSDLIDIIGILHGKMDIDKNLM